jgi:hypothetical protein
MSPDESAVTRRSSDDVRQDMTQLSERPSTELERPPGRARRPAWQIVLVAPFAGAVIGIVARGWMRLITDEPEFSWNGTIFIVGAFTVAATGHGLAWAARRAHLRRRWTSPARIVAAVLTLPIFVGAGVMMMPTVLCASLARHRSDWPKALRVILALIALPAPVIIAVDIARNGITPARVLGAVLLVATYTVVVRSTGAIVAPIDDGWRMRRSVRILVVAAAGLLVLFAVTSVVGVATAAL